MKQSLRDLHEEGMACLRAAGVTEASLDAKYLLLEAFHVDAVHYLMDQNQKLPDEDKVQGAIASYRLLIKKRAQRIPLQQLTGSTWFMGLEFKVNEHVLIPRQDTETLVEQVLKDYKGRNPLLLDLCTGSGCIAISLAVLGGYSHVTASDLSKEALSVAEENARRLAESRIEFLQGDLFEAFGQQGTLSLIQRRFDVIVSNPPYIPTKIIEGLEPEVRDHEPVLALDGKEDGLYIYRRLAAEAENWLNPQGAVYLEIGYDQGESVSGLLKDAGFVNVKVIKDTPGLDRVVRGELR